MFRVFYAICLETLKCERFSYNVAISHSFAVRGKVEMANNCLLLYMLLCGVVTYSMYTIVV